MAKYQEHEVDIPWVIQRLYPVPKYSGIARTYAHLQESWEDARSIPTWEEIEAEWDVWLAEKAAGTDPESVEDKIFKRIRKLAIDSLKADGKLPQDYVDDTAE